MGHMSRWRAIEEREVKMLSELGFWEGGVIPKPRSDLRSLASFRL